MPLETRIAAGEPGIHRLAMESLQGASTYGRTRTHRMNRRVRCVARVSAELMKFNIEKPVAASAGRRPPVVMTREEVRAVINQLENPWKLGAQLMYGSGLRLMESLRLRVKDLDFGQGTIAIHDGKNGKHRIVPLPRALEPKLHDYLATQQEKHQQTLASGCGEVHLPESLGRKYPDACREWIWQYLSAAATLCPHPRTGHIARYHLHEDSMARQLKQAVTGNIQILP